MLEGHKDLYWFGQSVPTSSSLLLVLPALVCSRGYKRGREGAGPKSLVKGSNGVESRRARSAVPFVGRPASAFIDVGKGAGYTREREREKSE